MAVIGRAIGLDVHLEFCGVAIVKTGVVRSAGRIETTKLRLLEVRVARMPPPLNCYPSVGSGLA